MILLRDSGSIWLEDKVEWDNTVSDSWDEMPPFYVWLMRDETDLFSIWSIDIKSVIRPPRLLQDLPPLPLHSLRHCRTPLPAPHPAHAPIPPLFCSLPKALISSPTHNTSLVATTPSSTPLHLPNPPSR